jgi:hypothetical protein
MPEYEIEYGGKTFKVESPRELSGEELTELATSVSGGSGYDLSPLSGTIGTAPPPPKPAKPKGKSGSRNYGLRVPKGSEPYVEAARQAAAKHGVDPDVYMRQIYQESRFNPKAVSPVGARGIAQFMPATAKGMGLADPHEPFAALEAGAKLMASHLKEFGGDYSKALAAYNAGPGRVRKYGGVPPFKETQNYVRTILGSEKGGAVGAESSLRTPKPVTKKGGTTLGILALAATGKLTENQLREKRADEALEALREDSRDSGIPVHQQVRDPKLQQGAYRSFDQAVNPQSFQEANQAIKEGIGAVARGLFPSLGEAEAIEVANNIVAFTPFGAAMMGGDALAFAERATEVGLRQATDELWEGVKESYSFLDPKATPLQKGVRFANVALSVLGAGYVGTKGAKYALGAKERNALAATLETKMGLPRKEAVKIAWESIQQANAQTKAIGKANLKAKPVTSRRGKAATQETPPRGIVAQETTSPELAVDPNQPPRGFRPKDDPDYDAGQDFDIRQNLREQTDPEVAGKTAEQIIDESRGATPEPEPLAPEGPEVQPGQKIKYTFDDGRETQATVLEVLEDGSVRAEAPDGSRGVIPPQKRGRIVLSEEPAAVAPEATPVASVAPEPKAPTPTPEIRATLTDPTTSASASDILRDLDPSDPRLDFNAPEWDPRLVKLVHEKITGKDVTGDDPFLASESLEQASRNVQQMLDEWQQSQSTGALSDEMAEFVPMLKEELKKGSDSSQYIRFYKSGKDWKMDARRPVATVNLGGLGLPDWILDDIRQFIDRDFSESGQLYYVSREAAQEWRETGTSRNSPRGARTAQELFEQDAAGDYGSGKAHEVTREALRQYVQSKTAGKGYDIGLTPDELSAAIDYHLGAQADEGLSGAVKELDELGLLRDDQTVAKQVAEGRANAEPQEAAGSRGNEPPATAKERAKADTAPEAKNISKKTPKEIRAQLIAKGFVSEGGHTLTERGKAAQPWEMTRAEYTEFVKYGAGQMARKNSKLGNLLHRQYVEIAIRDGKPVPKEVLADYPDIAGSIAPEAKPEVNVKEKSLLDRIDKRLEEIEKSKAKRAKNLRKRGREAGIVDISAEDFEYVALKAVKLAIQTGEKVHQIVRRLAKEERFTEEEIQFTIGRAKDAAGDLLDDSHWGPKAAVAEAGEGFQVGEGAAFQRQVADAIRAATDLEAIPDAEPQTVRGWAEEAVEKGYDQPDTAVRIASEYLSGEKQTLTPAEELGMASALDEMVKRSEKLSERYEATLGKGGDIELADLLAKETERINLITKAIRESGTEWGRVGRARQILMQEGTVLGEISARQRAAGRKLTSDEIAQARADFEAMKTLADERLKRNEHLEKRINDVLAQQRLTEQQLAKARASSHVKGRQRAKPTTSKRRGESRLREIAIKESEAKVKEIGARIAEKWKKGGIGNAPMGNRGAAVNVSAKLVEIAPDILELSKEYVKLGATKVQDNAAKVLETLKENDIDGITIDDVVSVIAGRVKPESVAKAKKALSEWEQLKQQAKELDEKAANQAKEAKRLAAQLEREGKRAEAKRLRDEAKAAEKKAKEDQKKIDAEMRERQKAWEIENPDLVTPKGKTVREPKETPLIKQAREKARAERSRRRKERDQGWRDSVQGERARVLNRIDKVAADLERLKKEGAVEAAKVAEKAFENDPILRDLNIKEASLRNRMRRVKLEMERQKAHDLLPSWYKTLLKYNPYEAVRSSVATLDNSFPFNQGGLTLLMDFGAWKEGFKSSWKSISDAGYTDAMEAIHADQEWYVKADAADLFEEGAFLNDAFGHSEFSRIPGMRQSEMMYMGAGNVMRFELFKRWAGVLEETQGRKLNVAELKDLAREVKTLTGMGQWGPGVTSRWPIVRKAFFALRFALSQYEVMAFAPIRRALKSGNKPLAKLLAKKYAKAAALGYGTMALVDFMLDEYGPRDEKGRKVWDIDTRLTSTNFGRLLYTKGDTQYAWDILPPAMRQYNALAQFIAGYRVTATGNTMDDQDYRLQALGEQVNYKLHPAPSLVWRWADAMKREDKKSFGKSYDLSTTEGKANVLKQMFPISAQQGADVLESDDFNAFEKTAFVLSGAVLRGGVQSLEDAGPVASFSEEMREALTAADYEPKGPTRRKNQDTGEWLETEGDHRKRRKAWVEAFAKAARSQIEQPGWAKKPASTRKAILKEIADDINEAMKR